MQRRRALRSGVYASILMTMLAASPQLIVWLARGVDETGAYAFFNEDEPAYCAYVNALIDGRPRRNDPYTGRDDSASNPQPESLFSIQFIPPYMLALTARASGLSAPSVFFALTCLAALASSLAVFGLVLLITKDEVAAAAAVFFVLCLGTFSILYGPIRMLLGLPTTYTFSHLPFLRRYLPAAPFALLFVFCALVWRAVTIEDGRKAYTSALLAGLAFGVLVFSYFYLWTSAAAWLACVILLWLLFRPDNFRSALKSLLITGALASLALLPYFRMLYERAPTMDSMQLLTASRAPDFSRSSEWLGIILALSLAYMMRRGLVKTKNTAALFALSFALAPLLIFNQQVITGRSLQPLHYEMYVTKYLTLLSLWLMLVLLRRARCGPIASFPKSALVVVALLSFGWGIVETSVATGRMEQAVLGRDEARTVASRLAEISRATPESHPHTSSLILYTNITHADISPAFAPQPVLWSQHAPAFSGLTSEENKERIHRLLYFTGFDETIVNARDIERLDYQKKYLLRSLIGWGHAEAAWSVNWRPVEPEEMQAQLLDYADYRARFDYDRAAKLPLTYVVTTRDEGVDFSNLDRWYERDAGEKVGKFVIYRVRLRR